MWGYCNNFPTVLKVHLKVSKTDQLRKGVDVFVGRTGGVLCPVQAFVNYVSVRDPERDCFFKFMNGDPLTKPKICG